MYSVWIDESTRWWMEPLWMRRVLYWWGGQLAWMASSLVSYVIEQCLDWVEEIFGQQNHHFGQVEIQSPFWE